MVLPPNPPPISAGTTLIRAVSHPSMAAVWARTLKWPCDEHHTVALPSWPASAVTAWGSM